MIDAPVASAIAQAFVESLDTWFTDPGDAPAVQWDATIELHFGWVFHWNARRFLETSDPRHALLGNTPFVVDRRDGSVHPLGTAYPLHRSVRDFADAWSRWAAETPSGGVREQRGPGWAHGFGGR
jgi:hypothetical protein